MAAKHWLAGTLVWLTLQCCAQALTPANAVTPQFVVDHPKTFSIKATRQAGGLISIAIVRHRSDREVYRVTDLEIRARSNVVAQSHATAFASADSQTYSIDLLPEYVAESQFTLSEYGFDTNGGEKTPIPGGTIYVIQFKDFAAP